MYFINSVHLKNANNRYLKNIEFHDGSFEEWHVEIGHNMALTMNDSNKHLVKSPAWKNPRDIIKKGIRKSR